jgi:hypothetical protein
MLKHKTTQLIDNLQQITSVTADFQSYVTAIEQQLNSLQSASDKTTVLLELLSSQGYKDWLNTIPNDCLKCDLNKFIICQHKYYQAMSNDDLLLAAKTKLENFVINGMEWYTPGRWEQKLGYKSNPEQFPSKQEEQAIQRTQITLDEHTQNSSKQIDDLLSLIMKGNVGTRSNSNDLHLYLNEAGFNLKHRGLHIRALKQSLMYAVVKLFDSADADLQNQKMAPLQYIYLSKMLDEKETICKFMDLKVGGMFSPSRDRENTGSRRNIRGYIEAAEKACVDNFLTENVGLYQEEAQPSQAISSAPHSAFTQQADSTSHLELPSQEAPR